MTATRAARTGGSTRAFAWIAAVAVVLGTLLSVGWFVAADRLDAAAKRAIEAAAGGGTNIACAGRDVFCYPFRIGLRCESIVVDVPAKGIDVEAGALRTAAQVYRPDRVVAELDGPLRLRASNAPPLEMNWSLLQASAAFWTSGLDRLSLAVDGPEIAGVADGERAPLARSDRLEVHVRRNGADLDLAVSDAGVELLDPDFAALPVFDAAAVLTVAGAADWLAGRRPGRTVGEALRGRSGTVRSLKVALAGGAAASAELSGPFTVSDDGAVSGAFDLALAEPQAIARLVAQLAPEAGDMADTLASALGLVGKRGEDGRTVVRIDVRNGEARLGFVPLGRLPPLR